MNHAPLDQRQRFSSAATSSTNVTTLHSATATSFAFVNAHAGRCVAVLFSVMALKWACRYTSPSMKVSLPPLMNPSRHSLTQMQYFSYWLPSAFARIFVSGLHPVALTILLFHPQLLQVMLCLFFY